MVERVVKVIQHACQQQVKRVSSTCQSLPAGALRVFLVFSLSFPSLFFVSILSPFIGLLGMKVNGMCVLCVRVCLVCACVLAITRELDTIYASGSPPPLPSHSLQAPPHITTLLDN